MDVIEAIQTRRSIGPKHLVGPGPDLSAVLHMVEAALAAPDHGGLRPWRVLQVAGPARTAFADLLVRARLAREPDADPDSLERERERAMAPPVTLVVCARVAPQDDVPAAEQWIAVGAAIQNLLLSAHAQGFGAKLLSGRKARDPLVRAGLGLRPEEEIAAFIALGTPVRPAEPRLPTAVTSAFATWAPAPCLPARGEMQ